MSIAFGTGGVEYHESTVKGVRGMLKLKEPKWLTLDEAERLHRELGAALEHARKVERQ